mmetsp:Transcript_42446/g.141193  ORF Transcript_42446/g.141193 Transcript_42446/m.141193 type:complete len:317 (+) Transcript_42446:561-1511(+)
MFGGGSGTLGRLIFAAAASAALLLPALPRPRFLPSGASSSTACPCRAWIWRSSSACVASRSAGGDQSTGSENLSASSASSSCDQSSAPPCMSSSKATAAGPPPSLGASVSGSASLIRSLSIRSVSCSRRSATKPRSSAREKAESRTSNREVRRRRANSDASTCSADETCDSWFSSSRRVSAWSAWKLAKKPPACSRAPARSSSRYVYAKSGQSSRESSGLYLAPSVSSAPSTQSRTSAYAVAHSGVSSPGGARSISNACRLVGGGAAAAASRLASSRCRHSADCGKRFCRCCSTSASISGLVALLRVGCSMKMWAP